MVNIEHGLIDMLEHAAPQYAEINLEEVLTMRLGSSYRSLS
jgi:hypothetical protein